MVQTSLARLLALSLGLLILLTTPPARAQVPATDPGSPVRFPESSGQPAPDGTTQISPPSPLPLEDDRTLPSPMPPISAEAVDHVPPDDSSGRAAGGFSPIFDPRVGHAPIRADYRATWLPAEPVVGQPTNLGYVQQDLSLSFPLWQCSTDEWLASASLRSETFHTHAILPDTGQPFPEDLWNVRFGMTYRHLFENGWIAGGTVSVGSASDQPFHSINEMTAGINGFLRVPQGEHNAWLFTLSYSPVSELPYPIPGVAFLWQPSEYFRANIGLPFQVMWRPVEDLTLDVSYMLLTTFHARATYRLCRRVRIYGAYGVENEAYLLADRVDSNDRFFNVDQRLTAGVLFNLTPKAALDLSSGYIFDHHFFEGQNITSGNNFNRIDVGNEPYVALQFRVRW
jgi:hypothetical protein